MMMRVMAHRHAESTAQSHTHARSLVVRSALVVSAVLIFGVGVAHIWPWRVSYLASALVPTATGTLARCNWKTGLQTENSDNPK